MHSRQLKRHIAGIAKVTSLRCPRAVIEKKNSEGKVYAKVAEPWKTHSFRETRSAFEIALWVPIGYSAKDLAQESDSLWATTGRPVTIHDYAGVVVVSIPKLDFPDTLPFKLDMLKGLKGREVLIGFDVNGKPIKHDFRVPHMLFAGMSGYGKTDLARFLLFQLIYRFPPEYLEIYIIDMKGFSFLPFAGIPHVKAIARTLPEAQKILSDAHAEMQARSDTIWIKRNRHLAKTFKWRVILIDEASQISPQLRDGEDKPIASSCWQHASAISCIGREAGIGILFGTQYPTREVIRGQIKANMDAVVSFKAMNDTHSEVTLDSPLAAYLPQGKAGRALLKEGLTPMIVPFVGDDDVWYRLLEPFKRIGGGMDESSKKTDNPNDLG